MSGNEPILDVLNLIKLLIGAIVLGSLGLMLFRSGSVTDLVDTIFRNPIPTALILLMIAVVFVAYRKAKS